MASSFSRQIASVVCRSAKRIHKINVRELSSLLPRQTFLAPRRHVLISACNCSQARTKGDQELSSFLAEEIQSEKKLQKSGIPKINGFEIKADGADVTLHGKFKDETITVSFNVNHSVDAEMDEGFNPNEQQASEMGEMKSKPNFDVEIQRGDQKLFFSCTFVAEEAEPENQQEQYNDLFSIVEFSMYKGEHSDKVYSVSGDIMDGYLYDLLMNMLEERGVSNEFTDQLSNFATAYEHSLYIKLLENLKGFVG